MLETSSIKPIVTRILYKIGLDRDRDSYILVLVRTMQLTSVHYS